MRAVPRPHRVLVVSSLPPSLSQQSLARLINGDLADLIDAKRADGIR
jgi:hypothetical protein